MSFPFIGQLVLCGGSFWKLLLLRTRGCMTEDSFRWFEVKIQMSILGPCGIALKCTCKTLHFEINIEVMDICVDNVVTLNWRISPGCPYLAKWLLKTDACFVANEVSCLTSKPINIDFLNVTKQVLRCVAKFDVRVNMGVLAIIMTHDVYWRRQQTSTSMSANVNFSFSLILLDEWLISMT